MDVFKERSATFYSTPLCYNRIFLFLFNQCICGASISWITDNVITRAITEEKVDLTCREYSKTGDTEAIVRGRGIIFYHRYKRVHDL